MRVREKMVHVVSDEGWPDLEFAWSPETNTLLRQRLPDGRIVVGYLVQDSHCQNPLDDCDGMGKIHDRRRGCRGSETENICLAAMGIDQYGQPCGKRDPDAVVLDVYSHSGDCWRIHGSGRTFPDERWDVSNGAGLWIPDDCCREHIDHTAIEKLLKGAVKVEYHSTPKKINAIRRYMTKQVTIGKSGYKTFGTAIRAAAKHLGIDLKKFKDRLVELRREVAVECAQQAVDEFNRWLSGDCWGVVTEWFDAEGEKLNNDSCWGYIGSEYAKEELKGAFEAKVKELSKTS